MQKATKNALETGRTFATLLADVDLRQRLLEARTEDDFKSVLLKHSQELAEEHSLPSVRIDSATSTHPAGVPPGEDTNVSTLLHYFISNLLHLVLVSNNK